MSEAKSPLAYLRVNSRELCPNILEQNVLALSLLTAALTHKSHRLEFPLMPVSQQCLHTGVTPDSLDTLMSRAGSLDTDYDASEVRFRPYMPHCQDGDNKGVGIQWEFGAPNFPRIL